jgi:Bacterial protein of unknown function (DUF922)
MRITACLLALLCVSTTGLAQGSIHWSRERRLTKSDFKGRVPLSAPSASMSWIHIETEWGCEDGKLVATARASFDPSQSWWRNTRGNVWGGPGERVSSTQAQQDARRSVLELDMQLLDHEQIHFDIAEVTARKIRARFAELKNACEEAGGTDQIGPMIVKADRELQEEQERYDRETGHGVNARVQDQWKQKVRALLN